MTLAGCVESSDMAKKTRPPKEPVVPVSVATSAHEALDRYCRDNRAIKRDIVAAVLLWFCDQPAAVQRVVIGPLDAQMAPHYAAVLRKLAEDAELGGVELTAPTRSGGSDEPEPQAGQQRSRRVAAGERGSAAKAK